MTAPKRLSIKFYFDELAVDAEAFVPVFHRWIREDVVPTELLLDVADYKHVQDGPAIFLVGHQADYILDFTDGKPGLQYVRKRETGDSLRDALALTLRQALHAVQLTQTDVELRGKLRLATDTATIALVDRLNYPNDDSADAVQQALAESLTPLFGDDATVRRVENDPRQPLTFQLHAPSAADAETLLSRLPQPALA